MVCRTYYDPTQKRPQELALQAVADVSWRLRNSYKRLEKRHGAYARVARFPAEGGEGLPDIRIEAGPIPKRRVQDVLYEFTTVLVRAGSFQLGRTKWQVYPLGYFCR